MMFVIPSIAEQKVWDELVVRSAGSVFSESRYLNAVSPNWGILFNTDKTGGIACPFSVKAGIKVLHSPHFHRYSEWIGEGKLDDSIVDELKQIFPVCELHTKEVVQNSIQRIHQVIDAKSYKLNQLAKRSLKKTENYIISSINSNDQLIQLIERELIPRIDTMETNSLVGLKRLVENFEQNGLRSYNVTFEGRFVGGIWVLENQHTHLYLKGTCEADAKKNGAMFLLMNAAIQACLEQGKTFDFGGSNAENVKRFNYHFGAQDCVYSHLQWNTAPFWWNGLRRINKLWKRK